MAKSIGDKREFYQLSKDDRETIKKIEILTRAVEKVYPSMGSLIWRSFIHGLFLALGSTIGLSIILAVVAFLIAQFKFIPVVNDLIKNVRVEQMLLERNK